MSYTIQVPASSIQKASQYGANVTIIGSGVSFADGTTVTSTLGAVITTFDPAYSQANAAFAQANAGISFTQSVYDYANTIGGGSAIDNVARISAQSAYLLANTLNANLSSQLSANVIYIAGVNSYQNSRIDGAYTQANNATNFFKGTTGSASPTNGSITLNSTTGMTFSGSGNTITINTPQSLSTTSGVTFNSLTLTNALPITQGGTGGTSASAALTNLLPTGTTAGYVLTTGGPGTFYWAAGGSGGGGGTTPGTTISSTRITYTANGSGLAYTTPTYVPGASQLRVYFDGLRQFASEYTETSPTVCTFNTVPTSGVVILFEVDGYINNPYYANTIPFTAPFGSIVSTANTIQLAIQDLETRKATLSSPALIGTPTAPTATNDTNSTQIATTAFVKNIITSGTSVYGGSITSSQVTTALGYTPYNAASISGASVSSATTSTYSTYLWATSHVGSYYISSAWDGSRWNITSNHGAATRVGWADGVAWTGVSGRPTALSQFSNNLGNYGGFIDGFGIVGDGVGTITDISRQGNTIFATKNCNCNCNCG